MLSSVFMTRRLLIGLFPLVTACSGGTGGGADMRAGSSSVVINELFPHGTSSTTDPDWAELKNNGSSAVDLTGYKVRDSSLGTLTRFPDGTKIEAGRYLIVYCDDAKDGGVMGGIHVHFKLSGGKGDEFHLVNAQGEDADATLFGADVPMAKSWGRLPDGTGAFIITSPTKDAPNI